MHFRSNRRAAPIPPICNVPAVGFDSDFDEYQYYLSCNSLCSSQSQGMSTTKNGGRFYPPSCFNLARQYLAGKGCIQSDEKAFKALERSCSASHAGACHFLGVLLLSKGDKDGPDVSRYDGVRGVEALRTACVDGGDVNSCGVAGGALLNVNNMYADVEKKWSLKSRTEQAEGLFLKGCEVGRSTFLPRQITALPLSNARFAHITGWLR